MFSIQRFINEFNAQFWLLSRRHGVILVIFTLWIILKHFLFFQFEHYPADLFNKPEFFDSIADPSFIILLVSIFISLDVFSKLRSSVGGIHYLMTPANTSEKFASAWLYSTLFTFICFTLVYNLTHILCMVCGNMIYDFHAEIHFQSLEKIWYLFSGTMLIQSVYFLGSVYFKKNPVGKTTLILFVTCLIFGYLTVKFFEQQFKEFFSIMSVRLNSPNGFHNFSREWLPQDFKTIYNIIKVIYYTLPFVFWGGAYVALKNKEV